MSSVQWQLPVRIFIVLYFDDTDTFYLGDGARALREIPYLQYTLQAPGHLPRDVHLRILRISKTLFKENERSDSSQRGQSSNHGKTLRLTDQDPQKWHPQSPVLPAADISLWSESSATPSISAA